MLLPVADVKYLIVKTCNDVARQNSYQIDEGATDPLTDIPPQFIRDGHVDIDRSQLVDTVTSLLIAAAVHGVVQYSSVQRAMQSGQCHYLWFC